MFGNYLDITGGILRSITVTVIPFRYSNNCTALVLSTAIFILGLSSSLAAPTNSQLDWLQNPCSKQPPIRHGRSPAENQLKILISFIDTEFIRELKTLYKPDDNIVLKSKCPKINNMLKPIKNANTKTLATQAFYETLLQIAVFIDKLKDLPIVTPNDFNFTKRKYIFQKAKESLRLVICEFNDTLSNLDNKSIQPNKLKVPKINLKCLPKTLNVTSAHTLDLDFFRKLKKFLRQSRRLLKRRKPKKGNAVNKKSGSNDKKRTKNLKH